MRRSQKDFLYFVGCLGFSAFLISDLQNTWKMLLFLLAFAGLNFYNYIKHKRNEEKWEDILDEYEDEDDKRKRKDKDKFNNYIRHIEDEFDYDYGDEEDEDDDE